MQPSRKLALALLAPLTLLVMTSATLAADPGLSFPIASEVSDQKAGSLLIYNAYTSSQTTPGTQDSRVSITNTSSTSAAFVHLFLVDGSTCSIADSFLCLTANETMAFLASDVDPGVSGYIVALAVDSEGHPAVHNFLIGSVYVKYASGHAGKLGAEAFTKLTDTNVLSTDGTLAALFFDGLPLAGSYNRAARTLALDNIPSRASGNDTLLIVNRIGGNLATGAATLGTLFGRLFDDAETALSFSISGGCQLRGSLSDTFPRTAPRFQDFIPAGHSGWLTIFSFSDIGILGASINFNPNAGGTKGAFNGASNLHKLTLSAAGNYVIPIFGPSC
jgi:hypothetical protein